MIFPQRVRIRRLRKSFLLLDNGLKREESYKAIPPADWIKTQPQALDARPRDGLRWLTNGGFITLEVATITPTVSERVSTSSASLHLATFLKNTESYRRESRVSRVRRRTRPENVGVHGKDRSAEQRRTRSPNRSSSCRKQTIACAEIKAEQIVATLKKQGLPVWAHAREVRGLRLRRRKTPTFSFYANVQFIDESFAEVAATPGREAG